MGASHGLSRHNRVMARRDPLTAMGLYNTMATDTRLARLYNGGQFVERLHKLRVTGNL
jgi:hypothetical protein